MEKFGYQHWHPALAKSNAAGEREVLQGLIDFKEHLGGELTITLLKDIGVGLEVNEMKEDLVFEAIEWLKQRSL